MLVRLPNPAYPASPLSERKLLSRQKDCWSPLLYVTPLQAETALQVPAKARSEISVLLGSLGSGWAVGRAGLGEPPTLDVLSEGEQAWGGGTKGAEDALSAVNQGHSTQKGNEKSQTEPSPGGES
jgi:hypothetical protein